MSLSITLAGVNLLTVVAPAPVLPVARVQPGADKVTRQA